MQLIHLDDLRPEGSNERCLRPLGLCTLGGCCDLCWYGPNSPKSRELAARRGVGG